MDGTDNRDPLQGLIVINPTLESVKEMKVTTQNYSAEFGEATAGVLTIQTRSGTNSWHGSVFDYRRTWKRRGREIRAQEDLDIMSVAVAHTPRTKKWSAKEACIVGGNLAREEGVLNETSTHVAHAA